MVGVRNTLGAQMLIAVLVLAVHHTWEAGSAQAYREQLSAPILRNKVNSHSQVPKALQHPQRPFDQSLPSASTGMFFALRLPPPPGATTIPVWAEGC